MKIILLNKNKDYINQIYKIEKENYKNPWDKDILIKELNTNQNSIYIGIIIKDLIIGFAGAWYIINYCHITNISIKKSHQSKGYGNLLTFILINMAIILNKEIIKLEVNIKNKKAINLYKKLKFKPLGIFKNYYNENEHAYIMYNLIKENITFFNKTKEELNKKFNLNLDKLSKKLLKIRNDIFN